MVSLLSRSPVRSSRVPRHMPRIPRGGPAVVLGLTTTVTLSAIFYSHFSQVRDKAAMRAGVERDRERIRLKRRLERQGGGREDGEGVGGVS